MKKSVEKLLANMEDEYPSKLLGEEGDSDSEEETVDLPVPNDD